MGDEEAHSSLPAVLAARARAASDGRLVLDVLGGVLAAGVLVVWRPPAWIILFGAAVCFAAFGLWGISDRELREQVAAATPRPVGLARLVKGTRWLSAVLGMLAALLVAFSVLGLLLGRMAS